MITLLLWLFIAIHIIVFLKEMLKILLLFLFSVSLFLKSC